MPLVTEIRIEIEIYINRNMDIQIYKHRNYISGEFLTRIRKDHFLPTKSESNAFIHQEQKVQNSKRHISLQGFPTVFLYFQCKII